MINKDKNEFLDSSGDKYSILEGGEAGKPAFLFDMQRSGRFIIVDELRNDDWLQGHYFNNPMEAALYWNYHRKDRLETKSKLDNPEDLFLIKTGCLNQVREYLNDITSFSDSCSYSIYDNNTIKIRFIADFSNIEYSKTIDLEDFEKMKVDSSDIILKLNDEFCYYFSDINKMDIAMFLINKSFSSYSHKYWDSDFGYYDNDELLQYFVEDVDSIYYNLRTFVDEIEKHESKTDDYDFFDEEEEEMSL